MSFRTSAHTGVGIRFLAAINSRAMQSIAKMRIATSVFALLAMTALKDIISHRR